jgi:nucleotide-binding universal stress UspA family protein
MPDVHLTPAHVVVAVDFSEDWANALAHGVAFARRAGRPVTALHVSPAPNWLLGQVLGDRDLDAHRLGTEEDARAKIAAQLAALGATDAVIEVRTGRPSADVVDVLDGGGATALVVGMGEPAGSALSLSANGDRLFRLSPVPVLVAGPRPPTPWRRILVPTALGPAGSTALRNALRWVEPGGTVHPLYMVALPSSLRAVAGDVMEIRQRMEEKAREAFARHVGELEVPSGVTVEPLLRTNLEQVPADKTILREARERDVDLVTFALGGKELPAGMLVGRVSEKVVRSLPCALLALPDRWADRTTPAQE